MAKNVLFFGVKEEPSRELELDEGLSERAKEAESALDLEY